MISRVVSRYAFLACVAAAGCAKSAPTGASAPAAELAATSQATSTQTSASTLFSANAYAQTTTRRVIHTAELWLDAETPEAVSGKLGLLAETRGGFVLNSDVSRSKDSDGSEVITATVVFRVPAAAFEETLAAAKALGTRVSNEKVTGQDVTEEYVDVEARIKAERAVEEQYLSVLKEAKNITDILAVQQKLGEVRTEIERSEGRRRFLESQTNLSTVTVHVARHLEAVETSGPGFGRSLKEAGRDALSVSIAIINGTIRLVGVFLPVGALVVAPAVLLVRAWMQRRRRLARGALRPM
jgi:hypothetical protein